MDLGVFSRKGSTPLRTVEVVHFPERNGLYPCETSPGARHRDAHLLVAQLSSVPL